MLRVLLCALCLTCGGWRFALAQEAVTTPGAQEPCEVRPEESVLAEISTRRIDVASDFTGTLVMVFGAIDCPGDVIVVVRGPRRLTVVREKVRVAGIWVNGSGVAFEDAPALYAVASTRPPEQLLPRVVLRAHGIGVDDLRLSMREDGRAGWPLYREALIAHNEQQALYTRRPLDIQLTGDRLFRANFWLPSIVPTGDYLAEVYYVRDNKVIGTVSVPFVVGRVGLEARIFAFAHEHPEAYGALAVALTVLAGWLVGVVFRRT
jgi:uncharacterized protein (TIGR02186 family)